MGEPAPDEATVRAADRVLSGVVRLGSRMRSERPRGTRLSMGMLGVLLRLAHRPEMMPGELAESIGAAPQSMTRILAGLEERGLVARRTDPRDRRASLVSLTDAGRDALAADGRARRTWLAAAMTGLTPAERELLAIAGDLMDRLADADPYGGATADGAGTPE
ncbi:MarR family winged helix-turn-helix transcriptional regulator [Actinocatenispora rupis]|uniref:MarR family transcriptional regulator n=1 Tax=Actinocatenispora rupis TaxID=519421 RepID=A0A8J3J470_9ACTN|nr:MarR family transcriptional regulator [Actinocatenispora rupis]GID09804.1 MarR family transcriptional regulator [Actinocatenispora rupis]